MNLGDCSFEEVDAIAVKIDGWLKPAEAKLLYDTALSLKGTGAIVEIGSWCSKSITYMTAAALKKGNDCKKICIDPFLTSKNEPNGAYETFVSNLKTNGIYDKVTHIKEKSQIVGESFNENIELLFIDGFHQYEAVKSDFELFFKNVVKDGFVIIHDIPVYEGPTKLIKELAQSNSSLKIIDIIETAVIAQKVENLSENDKKHNLDVIKIIDDRLVEKKITMHT